jgi:hypothetical protein
VLVAPAPISRDRLALDVPALRQKTSLSLRTPRPCVGWLWLGLSALVLGLLLGGSDGALARPKAKAKDKGKKPKTEQKLPDGPGTPTTPATPSTTGTDSKLPLVAVRMECSTEEKTNRLCETVQEAAIGVAARKFAVVDPAKVEALFSREPSLRGCRRDECRTAIAEQLGLFRLIDIILQSPKHRGLIANVAIFDPSTKGIAADTEVQLKREEGKLRRSIEEAVDLVINTQRLAAPLRLEIKPAGARVKLIDGRGGTRELTDAERDGSHEVRVFLGPYTVHVEKTGFQAQDQSVTVAQAGASVSVQLKTQPVAVKFEWTPPDTRVLVDGESVDTRDKVIEVSEGSHKVEAIAPRGSIYESTVFNIDVRVGMEPVRISLQRLTELRLTNPAGYTLSVDGQGVAASQLQVHDRVAETQVPTTPGPHTVTAISWRGHQISQRVEAHARTSTDLTIHPPSLVGGAVIGTLGLLATVAGGAVFAVGNLRDICTRDDCSTFFKPDLVGGLLVGLGGAAFIAGVSWFGWSAANHPLFHKVPPTKGNKSAATRSRLSLIPVVGGGYAGIQSELRF